MQFSYVTPTALAGGSGVRFPKPNRESSILSEGAVTICPCGPMEGHWSTKPGRKPMQVRVLPGAPQQTLSKTALETVRLTTSRRCSWSRTHLVRRADCRSVEGSSILLGTANIPASAGRNAASKTAERGSIPRTGAMAFCRPYSRFFDKMGPAPLSAAFGAVTQLGECGLCKPEIPDRPRSAPQIRRRSSKAEQSLGMGSGPVQFRTTALR